MFGETEGIALTEPFVPDTPGLYSIPVTVDGEPDYALITVTDTTAPVLARDANARVYTLHGVDKGTHTIKQGTGGESGLFYVSANNTVFAYAPWMASPGIAWSTPPSVATDRLLPFTATNSNTTDLM